MTESNSIFDRKVLIPAKQKSTYDFILNRWTDATTSS